MIAYGILGIPIVFLMGGYSEVKLISLITLSFALLNDKVFAIMS
jgi:hypothetical protein